MRKLRQSGDDVADGVETRFLSFQIGVGVNESTLDLGFRFFEADIFGERAASHCNQNFLSGDRLRFPGFVFVNDGRALRVLFHRFHFGLKLDANPLFLEGFFELRRNVFIFQRHDARQSFEQRHLGAERAIDRSEFDSHRAAAHHHQRFGNPWKVRISRLVRTTFPSISTPEANGPPILWQASCRWFRFRSFFRLFRSRLGLAQQFVPSP